MVAGHVPLCPHFSFCVVQISSSLSLNCHCNPSLKDCQVISIKITLTTTGICTQFPVNSNMTHVHRVPSNRTSVSFSVDQLELIPEFSVVYIVSTKSVAVSLICHSSTPPTAWSEYILIPPYIPYHSSKYTTL